MTENGQFDSTDIAGKKHDHEARASHTHRWRPMAWHECAGSCRRAAIGDLDFTGFIAVCEVLYAAGAAWVLTDHSKWTTVRTSRLGSRAAGVRTHSPGLKAAETASPVGYRCPLSFRNPTPAVSE